MAEGRRCVQLQLGQKLPHLWGFGLAAACSCWKACTPDNTVFTRVERGEMQASVGAVQICDLGSCAEPAAGLVLLA